MKNTTINAAKKMLEDGLPIETISKYTGLMKNEIEKLRETYQLTMKFDCPQKPPKTKNQKLQK